MKFKDKTWKVLSITAILLYFSVMMYQALSNAPRSMGESDDYTIATISIQNHLSTEIFEEDVIRAEQDFPELARYIRDSWEQPLSSTRFFNFVEGKRFSWYFGTYSGACIPIKLVLQALGVNQEYCFQFTNIVSYTLALLVLFQFLKKKSSTVFFTLLALTLAPISNYYFWPSAEMFIASLVICATVFFVNKNYTLSSLFVSIAATLNPTISAFGVMIIFKHFYDIYQKEKKMETHTVLAILKNNFWNLAKHAAMYIPFLYSLFYNWIVLSTPFPQTLLGFSKTSRWVERFFSYLFDLNLGFFPFAPVFVILFFVIFLYAILKKDAHSIFFGAGFLVTVFAFARTWHINCGMTGISRYGAWSMGILLIFVCTNLEKVLKKEVLSKLVLSFGIVIMGSMSILPSMGGADYLAFTSVAKLTLNNAPSLYTPYYYTFISRLTHKSGGYYEKGETDEFQSPFFYINEKTNEIRKILVTPGDIAFLERAMEEGIIFGSEESLAYLKNETEKKHDQEDDFFYITIPKKYSLQADSTQLEAYQNQYFSLISLLPLPFALLPNPALFFPKHQSSAPNCKFYCWLLKE